MAEEIKRILVLDHPMITGGYVRDLGEDVVIATDSWHVAEKAYDKKRPDILVVEPYEIMRSGDPHLRHALIEQALCQQVPTIVTTTQYWLGDRCPGTGFEKRMFAAFFDKPFDTFRFYAALQGLGVRLPEGLKGAVDFFCADDGVAALVR